jgi:hypothetical protein
MTAGARTLGAMDITEKDPEFDPTDPSIADPVLDNPNRSLTPANHLGGDHHPDPDEPPLTDDDLAGRHRDVEPVGHGDHDMRDDEDKGVVA